MSNLKIGIDSRILKTHPKRGSSRHLVSVISSIEKNSVILFSNEYIDLSEFGLDGYKLIVGGVKNYLLWEQLFLPYFLVKNKINYLYSPNHTSPIISPCNKIIAVAVNCLDVEPISKTVFGIRVYWVSFFTIYPMF